MTEDARYALALAVEDEPTVEWALGVVDAYLSGAIDLPFLASLGSNPHWHFRLIEDADDAYSCEENMLCIFAAGLWSTGISIVNEEETTDPADVTNDMRWWRARLLRGSAWWRAEAAAGRWPPDDETIVL